MITILWTIYLFISIYSSVILGISIIDKYTADFLYKEDNSYHIRKGFINIIDSIYIIVTSILWSIWYMYFLH